jgi:hypothetical protein
VAFSTTNPGPIERNRQDGEILEVLLGASQTVKKGNIIIIKAADGLGYTQFADASSATGDIFAGIATEDVTSGASGDYYVKCWQKGVFSFTAAAGAQANVGKYVYTDGGAAGAVDQVIVTDVGHNCKIGTIVGFDNKSAGTAVRVKIIPFTNPAA